MATPPLTRRGLLGLAGVALLSACGSSRPSAGAGGTATGAAPSGAAGSPPAPTSGEPTATVAGPSATVASASPQGLVAHLGGPHVPATQAVSIADATRVAMVANGTWSGGWRDSTGRSGMTDAVITIDGMARTATVVLSFTGPLLGAEVPTQTYVADLLSFALTADSYTITSPQFGPVTMVPGGVGSVSGSAGSPVGHPEITGITVSGTRRTAQRADVQYVLAMADGTKIMGTMAWSSAGVRAVPAAPHVAGAPPTLVDIQSGAYAASLLTAAGVSKAVGKAFKEPETNGGRVFVNPDVNVSNGRVESVDGDYVVQYSVYIGKDAAAIDAPYKPMFSYPGVVPVPGPWEHAEYQQGIGLYILQKQYFVEVSVGPMKELSAAQQQEAIAKGRAWSIAVGKLLLAAIAAG